MKNDFPWPILQAVSGVTAKLEDSRGDTLENKRHLSFL